MSHTTIEENLEKWKSPFIYQDIARKTLNFTDVHIDCGKIYWCESRPWEKGLSIIVSCSENGAIADETLSNFNVTSSVHGYGGGSFIVKNNIIYFNDAITNQIFKKDIVQNITSKITFQDGFRYADFSVDKDHKFLYCLRLAQNPDLKFPITQIVRVEILTGLQETLFSGADFYSNIRVSADGKKLLFLQWNYPNMPWDENELWVASIEEDFKVTKLYKAFHEHNISIYQPEWSLDNKIYFACDKNNFWNLFELLETQLIPLFSYKAEFGRPLWTAGNRVFCFASPNEIVANCCENGIWKTFLINLKNNKQKLIDNKLTCFYNMVANKNSIVYIGGNELQALSVIRSDLKNSEQTQILRTSSEIKINSLIETISIPKLIEFNSQSNKVFAFYYPPKNKNYTLKKGELPPCIIKVHGGPTTCADFMFNPKIQFYTSRGYAYVEINYSGSSGYGREYRTRINKLWGVADVADCIACAEYLKAHKLAHPEKLILSGGSSGGFTLLNVLTKSNIFKCASCYYGIADLIDLANHIHKFEACYDQILIGDTIEHNPALYKERSPINYAQNIKCPVIFFHGDKDPVVHVSQTLKMAEALKEQNIYNEVNIFAGEGHGFKKEDTIISVLEKELLFFSKVLNQI